MYFWKLDCKIATLCYYEVFTIHITLHNTHTGGLRNKRVTKNVVHSSLSII